jgi:phosphoribosyl 1,2-cyclic phosphodiesterase
MSTDDAVKIIDQVHPELAVMTHLGMSVNLAYYKCGFDG